MRLTDKAREAIRIAVDEGKIRAPGGVDALMLFIEGLPDLAGIDGYESRVADKVITAQGEARAAVAELQTALDDMGNIAALRRQVALLRSGATPPPAVFAAANGLRTEPGVAAWLDNVLALANSTSPTTPIDPVMRTLEVIKEMVQENPAIWGELGSERVLADVRQKVGT